MRKITAIGIAAITMLSATSAFAQQTYHNIGNFGNSAPGGSPTLAINGFATSPQHAGLYDDTTTATPTVTNSFTLTGTVAPDCSYYSGAANNQTNIPLGAIGVRNGNTETVNNLFNQVGAFNVEITSTSAGCNTNNKVTVTHNADGLVNPTAANYDTNNFTTKIPYTIVTGLQYATPIGTTGAGIYQAFTVAPNTASNNASYGAWRSRMTVTAQIPAQSLGLVAGTYSDTIVVTLQTL